MNGQRLVVIANRIVNGLLAHGEIAQIEIGIGYAILIIDRLGNGQCCAVIAVCCAKFAGLVVHSAGDCFRQIARPVDLLPGLFHIPFVNVEQATLKMQFDGFAHQCGSNVDRAAIGGMSCVGPPLALQCLA